MFISTANQSLAEIDGHFEFVCYASTHWFQSGISLVFFCFYDIVIVICLRPIVARQMSKMKTEINAATRFISEFLINAIGLTGEAKVYRRNELQHCLMALLLKKFDGHWYPGNSRRGQGYRCIRLEKSIPLMDPVVEKALQMTGLTCPFANWPQEMFVWVDPEEVSYQVIYPNETQRVRHRIYPDTFNFNDKTEYSSRILPPSVDFQSELNCTPDAIHPPNFNYPPPILRIPPPWMILPPPMTLQRANPPTSCGKRHSANSATSATSGTSGTSGTSATSATSAVMTDCYARG